MKYKNKNYRKIRSSFIMIISCGYCKEDIISYQKVGKGGLINLYIDRIIEAEFDFTSKENQLICPNCGEVLGGKMLLKRENNEVYKMYRSSFNTRKK